ncbi:unnamed protein product [Kuraishia capsulata CBS 1993]|uniref:Translation initiation factor IF-2, mitochondrial n=1 Tax=Kuraishia capsulata CBS 1993 TaxID=1382522 RepID=W6MSX3_9ASCO|nr:uncharacterized protein KUCA_T00000837001 [Kuraishia capsulata CBS 1993]CDK24870.1 unnamed protein product [Kuraishia capsulata CBS 1993]
MYCRMRASWSLVRAHGNGLSFRTIYTESEELLSNLPKPKTSTTGVASRSKFAKNTRQPQAIAPLNSKPKKAQTQAQPQQNNRAQGQAQSQRSKTGHAKQVPSRFTKSTQSIGDMNTRKSHVIGELNRAKFINPNAPKAAPHASPSPPPPAPAGSKFKEKKNELRNLARNMMTKHETELSVKQEKERKKKAKLDAQDEANAKNKVPIAVPRFLSVSNFATILKVRTDDLLRRLSDLGFEDMSYNYILDAETAALVADEYGFDVTMSDDQGMDLFPGPIVEAKLKPRPPIVTIMGHVDHGKTTILDYLRKSSIVDKEFGGITQHIGAFSVLSPHSKKQITFLDTPGHAAFLKMRERGANITDIIILVVAADDSVMPQTKEAIKHAKAANVPVIVAINKCDKPDAKPDRVVADLATGGIDVEDYGGETQTVKVSGKTGLGMEELEEAVVALAEMHDFKAEPSGVDVEGWVIESHVKQGMGNTATFLVRRGTLKPGMFIVAGTTYAKVRSLKDEFGKPLKAAGPSTPVEVTGWKGLPEAGDEAIEAKNESVAKKVIANRIKRAEHMREHEQITAINESRRAEAEQTRRAQEIDKYRSMGLQLDEIRKLEPDLFEEEGVICKKIPFIVKADVAGSAEAIEESIKGLGNEEVQSQVLFSGVGVPTDSDVDRAKVANGSIICFNVNIPKDIEARASRDGVPLKKHNVIYHLIEDVIEELVQNLPPKFELKSLAKADVKAIFEITGKNKKVNLIAGCRVSEGVLKRNSTVRVMRKGVEIYRGPITELKHEKDNVTDVRSGTECGVSLGTFSGLQEGDVIEAFEMTALKRFL